jgi:hypothetical protein
MGLTHSRRRWRAEETSAVHPSSANNINEKKTNKDEEEGEKEEKNDEVCF